MKRCSLAMVFMVWSVLATTAQAQENQRPGDAGPQAGPAFQPTTDSARAAESRFLTANPDARLYRAGSRITRVYGTSFKFGVSAEATAEKFRLGHAAMLGAEPDDLLPVSHILDGGNSLPVMYDWAAGEYKFTLVYYSQYRAGIPVFRSDVRLLIRNEQDHPLVLVSSSLRNLGNFAPDAALARVSFDPALQVASKMTNFTIPETVIWAGVEDMEVDPVVAVTFVGDNYDQPGAEKPEKWLYVCDPVTGEILYQEDLIIFVDVTGNVSGMATSGPKSDNCGPEVVTAMPYARVNIVGGSTAYADVDGDFVVPHGGVYPVTVESPMAGQYFYVDNAAGDEETLSQSVIPPGPANFMHNQANTSALVRAQVNGYIQANVVRDFILAANPSYPVISSQTNFPVIVNRTDGYCPGNAWYDGSSINFCQAGGNYPNTAWSSVVHHEYGHHLVAVGGSGQGQYGEGMGDCMSVIILDDPIIGWGFFGNCNGGLRNADNNLQYPCSGPIHDCGQLISGCVWDTRNELLVTEPDDYLEILGYLTVNSVLLHSGSSITPQITIDFLTLDDDDGNIGNGTPHRSEICAGFGAHRMDCPELNLISFEYPDGLPEMVIPGQETIIRVNVEPVSGMPVSGTGTVSYRIGNSGMFTTDPMSEGNPNEYEATLPAADCPDVIQFYFSAEASGGITVTDPSDAPASTFAAVAASDIIVAVDYDFETDPGWAVSGSVADGAWERAIPAGGGDRGDPPSDFDGSGRCWVTDNADGNSDVDNGSTILTSQIIDLGGLNDPYVGYARWYSNVYGNSPYQDTFTVQVSSNGGGSWASLETVGPAGPEVEGDWYVREFRIADFTAVTPQFRIRFTASDTDPQSVVEAGIDAFRIFDYECDVSCPDPADGDLNGDGATNGLDIRDLVDGILGSPTPDEICHGDFNGNNGLDVGDIDDMVTALLAP